MDRTLIETYAKQAGAVAEAIQGLTQPQLDAFPVPGTWSIRQIVVHLMDSDLIGSDRMKRLAVMDRPLLVGYDENAFMSGLSPHRVDAFQAAEVFRLNRELTAVVLRSLPDAAFERFGIHTETGKVTLGDQVQKYVGHAEHHLRFLREKRAKLGA